MDGLDALESAAQAGMVIEGVTGANLGAAEATDIISDARTAENVGRFLADPSPDNTMNLATDIAQRAAEAGGLSGAGSGVISAIPEAITGAYEAMFNELNSVLRGGEPDPSRVGAPILDLMGEPIGIPFGSMTRDYRTEGHMSWSELSQVHGPLEGTYRAFKYWLLEGTIPR